MLRMEESAPCAKSSEASDNSIIDRSSFVRGIGARYICGSDYGWSLDHGIRTREQFGRNADKYRRSRTQGDASSLDHIVGVIAPSADAEALDVGCGGGQMAVALASKVRSVVAVDITPEMLAQTALLAGEKELINLVTCLSDARHLAFRDEAFDVVACRIVLHHLQDVDRAVPEMGRVTKRGGMLLIQDILGSDCAAARDYMDEIEKLRDPSHVRDYDRKEWAGFLGEAGLRMIHEETLHGSYWLKDWTARSATPAEKVREIERRIRELPPHLAGHIKVYDSGSDWMIGMMYILLMATK